MREGLGAVLKVADGAVRAAAPSAVALLTKSGALDPGEAAALAEFATPAVCNVAGTPVGRIWALV